MSMSWSKSEVAMSEVCGVVFLELFDDNVRFGREEALDMRKERLSWARQRWEIKVAPRTMPFRCL